MDLINRINGANPAGECRVKITTHKLRKFENFPTKNIFLINFLWVFFLVFYDFFEKLTEMKYL